MRILNDGSIRERITAGQPNLDDVFHLLAREGPQKRAERKPALPASIPIRMPTVSSTAGYHAVTYVTNAGCKTRQTESAYTHAQMETYLPSFLLHI